MLPLSIHVLRRSPRPVLFSLQVDSARAAPLIPPADVPVITSTRAVLPAHLSSSPYALPSVALASRSISWATPPIQMARLTPPLRTTARRSSSRAGPAVVAGAGCWPLLAS